VSVTFFDSARPEMVSVTFFDSARLETVSVTFFDSATARNGVSHFFWQRPAWKRCAPAAAPLAVTFFCHFFSNLFKFIKAK
jgi:hypothetical protein